jgi:hypothetical protein
LHHGILALQRHSSAATVDAATAMPTAVPANSLQPASTATLAEADRQVMWGTSNYIRQITLYFQPRLPVLRAFFSQQ